MTDTEMKETDAAAVDGAAEQGMSEPTVKDAAQPTPPTPGPTAEAEVAAATKQGASEPTAAAPQPSTLPDIPDLPAVPDVPQIPDLSAISGIPDGGTPQPSGQPECFKKTLMRKLSSRKFWAAIAAVAISLGSAFGLTDVQTHHIVGIISAVSALVAYIIGESYVDCKKK